MNRSIGKSLVAVALLGIVFLNVLASAILCWKPVGLDNDQKARQWLKPAIEFVEGFLAEHERLPTEKEFDAWNEKRPHHYNLRDRSHPYAASKGASGRNDYMVGVWRGEWTLYYKSWDKTYYDAQDEGNFQGSWFGGKLELEEAAVKSEMGEDGDKCNNSERGPEPIKER